jgi:hypothetical protein
MPEEIKPILKNLLKTRANYSETKEGATQIRVNLDAFESKRDEGINKITKAITLYEAISEEQVSNPSSALGSLNTSGSYLSEKALEHSERFKDDFETYIHTSVSLLGTANVSDVSGNVILNVAEATAKIVALRDPEVEEVIRELDLPSPFEKRQELKSELEKINASLASMVEGAWQTLMDESKLDRYRQAADSMRDVITNLLNLLAPHEEVKQAEWYEQIADKNQATRNQRVKYAIMGGKPEIAIDEKDLEEINNLAKDTNDAYHNLSKFHTIEVEGAILIESYMDRSVDLICLILKLRKIFF